MQPLKPALRNSRFKKTNWDDPISDCETLGRIDLSLSRAYALLSSHGDRADFRHVLPTDGTIQILLRGSVPPPTQETVSMVIGPAGQLATQLAHFQMLQTNDAHCVGRHRYFLRRESRVHLRQKLVDLHAATLLRHVCLEAPDNYSRPTPLPPDPLGAKDEAACGQ